MAAPADHQLQAERVERCAQLLLPLNEEEFAGDQDKRDLAAVEAVADRTKRGEGLPRAGRMLKDPAAIAFLPGLKGVHLMRSRCPPVGPARFRRPPRGPLHVEADFVNEVGPAAGVGSRDNGVVGNLGERANRDPRPLVGRDLAEIIGLIVDPQRFALVAPTCEDVDRFKIAVPRQPGPSLVHRALEGDAVADVGQDADLVVEQALGPAANVVAHPGDLAVDDARCDQRCKDDCGLASPSSRISVWKESAIARPASISARSE